MQNELRLTSLSTAFINKLKEQGKTLNTLKNYKTDLDCYKMYLRRSIKKMTYLREQTSTISLTTENFFKINTQVITQGEEGFKHLGYSTTTFTEDGHVTKPRPKNTGVP